MIKAADVNRNHLGLRVRVYQGDDEFVATLSGVSHQADLIDERPITAEVAQFTLGRITTTLTLTNGGTVHVQGTADVEVLEG